MNLSNDWQSDDSLGLAFYASDGNRVGGIHKTHKRRNPETGEREKATPTIHPLADEVRVVRLSDGEITEVVERVVLG